MLPFPAPSALRAPANAHAGISAALARKPLPTAVRRPQAGSLEWLLSHGLAPATGQGGAAGRVDVFSQPEQPLRDQARMAAAEMLCDGFKARLNVMATPPGATQAEQWAGLRKSMATAYLLGLPVSRPAARRLYVVEQWRPQQVFGCSAEDLVALLRRLTATTLAELGVNRMPPGEIRDEMTLAARDFNEYAGECVDRVGDMRRSDGSLRRQLSADTMARIRCALPPVRTAAWIAA